jgi:hypothetical protein
MPLLNNNNTSEMESPDNRLTLNILKKEADYVPVYTTWIQIYRLVQIQTFSVMRSRSGSKFVTDPIPVQILPKR